MSSAGIVELTPETHGAFHAPQITPEAAQLASKLLQQNHDKHHMYFNASGFHNHIAHHVLAEFALGASPQQLQHAYDNNAGYQRSPMPTSERNIQSMSDPAKFKEFLNNEKYFNDYQNFFEKEIDAASGNWGSVLHKHLFSKTPEADDMLVRMFSGFFHPIIHLGYGVEFRQPAIIAEAMGQAATHDNWPGKFLNTTSKLAREATAQNKPTKPLVQLLHEARAQEVIRKSARSSDANKVRDGVLVRAASETANLAANFRIIDPNDGKEMARKTAEMINAAAYFTAGAQHPSHRKQIKFDFYYIHCMNCSVFFSAFLDPVNDDWLSNEDRARMLEYKAWTDIGLYISRGCPELFLSEITDYQPKRPDDGWKELFHRVNDVPDDGHSSKLVRAFGNGEKVCVPFEAELDEKTMPIRGDMWLKMGHMAVDSVEGANSRWVRNAGFEEAWKDIPDRANGWPDGTKGKTGQNSGEHYHE